MKKLFKSNVIPMFLPFILIVIFNTFGQKGCDFWTYYYFIIVNLSFSGLMFINLKNVNPPIWKIIGRFIGFFFLLNSYFVTIQSPFYWRMLAALIVLIIYFSISSIIIHIKLKKFPSDEYNKKDNFIIVRSPISILERVISLFTFGTVGSIHMVRAGQHCGFKHKPSHKWYDAVYKEEPHRYNPERWRYIKTEKHIYVLNTKYHLINNNCKNAWNVPIMREIKNRVKEKEGEK